MAMTNEFYDGWQNDNVVKPRIILKLVLFSGVLKMHRDYAIKLLSSNLYFVEVKWPQFLTVLCNCACINITTKDISLLHVHACTIPVVQNGLPGYILIKKSFKLKVSDTQFWDCNKPSYTTCSVIRCNSISVK